MDTGWVMDEDANGAGLRWGVDGSTAVCAFGVLFTESVMLILEMAASRSPKLMWLPDAHASSLESELSPLVEALGVT